MEASENNAGQGLSGSGNQDIPFKLVAKRIWYIFSGSVVTVIWLALFIAGLMVNSSYYRTAVNYGFAELSDWIWVILTFTVSNVAILAFFAGLLGGIISKLRATQGFTVDPAKVLLDSTGKEDKSIQVENPFISAVRGMFVFIAILFMQYVSSFNDLGSIAKNADQQPRELSISYEKISERLAAATGGDTVLQGKIDKVIAEQIAAQDAARTDAEIVERIFILKESLAALKKKGHTDTTQAEMMKLRSELKTLRRTLKPPPDADFSQVGISSFSYFKFAVIVSFLAFIFGYDASKFANFLGRIPLFASRDKPADNGGKP